MPRPILTLPFGQGLDRASGIGAVQPNTFVDLRNVHLGEGRVWARGGMDPVTPFPGEDAILAIHPLRSKGIGVAVTYRTGTREVRVWRVAHDGETAAAGGVVWTLPAGASFPRVICADAANKVYLAHDEPTYALRQVTRVYDPTAGTLADFAIDLIDDGVTTPVAAKFRGVARWMDRLVAWGYGSEAAGAGDRPEILRLSQPGQPDTFLPNSYFIVGQQGEPIVSARPAGTCLKVLKEYEAHDLTGTTPSTFGMTIADPYFGCAASRLAVDVGGSLYCWSAQGPRVADGPGPSRDLALPLDLPGVPPDLLAASSAPEYGFAYFDPNEREVVFLFGRWGYCLHLKGGAMRWSYREHPVELYAAGTLYPSLVAAFGPTSHPEFAAIETPASGDKVVSMSLTTVGTWQAGTLVERWRRDVTASGPWALVDLTAAASGTFAPPDDDAPAYATEYAYAVRYKLDGAYGTGYLSLDPSDWPAASRATTTTGDIGAGIVPDITDLAVTRAGSNATFSFTAPPLPDWSVALWESDDAGLTFYDTGVVWHAGDVYQRHATSGVKHWRVIASATGYAPSGPSNEVSA